MKTLSAVLIAAKNALSIKSGWIYLLEITKEGWFRIDYDNLTSPFHEEASLSESPGTATADILFVEEVTETTGYLIVNNPGGDKNFGDGNTITDDHSPAGSAQVNGTVDMSGTAYNVFRFARNTESITYNGNVYYALPFGIDPVVSTMNEFSQLELSLSNVDRVPELWMRKGQGFKDQIARLMVIYLGDLAQNPAFDETFTIKKASATNEFVTMVLSRANLFFLPFPRFRYHRKRCMWRFKGLQCGYSGSDTTCDRDFAACIDKANEDRFGGNPGIPGSFLDA